MAAVIYYRKDSIGTNYSKTVQIYLPIKYSL